jgi:hypothetical protein
MRLHLWLSGRLCFVAGQYKHPSTMTGDPEDFDEQYLEIRNRAENKESISLIVQGSDSVITQGEYEVAAGQTISVPLQITEKGNYELTFSRSGGIEISSSVVISCGVERGRVGNASRNESRSLRY